MTLILGLLFSIFYAIEILLQAEIVDGVKLVWTQRSAMRRVPEILPECMQY